MDISDLKTDNENGVVAAGVTGVIGDVPVAAVAAEIETAGGSSRRQVAGVSRRKSHG